MMTFFGLLLIAMAVGFAGDEIVEAILKAAGC